MVTVAQSAEPQAVILEDDGFESRRTPHLILRLAER